MRVQIPAYTDRWMMGDRFGTVTKVNRFHDRAHGDPYEVAVVKLDKSKKTVRVILDDCTIVETG